MIRAARAAILVAVVALSALALASGCAARGPAYVDKGTAYTKASALAVLGQVDVSPIATKPTSDGVRLRHDALAALRRRGAAASAIADLLTRTFPSDTSGVPVYVERGSYNGKPVVLVVEATGPPTGSLNSKRLWVVADNGDILLAGSR